MTSRRQNGAACSDNCYPSVILDIRDGAAVGPYRIVALLGAGGMGEVYRAHDPRIGRDVAIKVLPRAVAEDEDRLRRFEREAHAAGALNHPNLLTVFELGNHDGSPFIVCELLEGSTLAEVLLTPSLVDPLHAHRSPLPLRRAVQYATQIASGLAAAHDKGIVHRDLKPQNIFITADDRVKLLDFGLAKIISIAEDSAANSDRSTTPGAIVGTSGYMAPEQIRGQVIDHRADIFAFGAVLYRMITGREAFTGETVVETMNAILHDDPQPIPAGAVPASLVRIVEHALAKNPSMRFQSMRDVAFTLEAIGSSDDRTILTPSKRTRKAKIEMPSAVAFSRVTYRRGFVMSARFAPDGSTIYGAAWEDRPLEIVSSHPGNPESRSLGLPSGDILSVSRNGDLAISIGRHYVVSHVTRGTLARVPLSGGAPRELCDDVQNADWTPDGKELLIVRSAGDRYRIELPIGNVIYETPLNWISSPRISPRGDLIAFTEHPVLGDDQGFLVIIDRAGKIKMKTPPLWSVSGIVWTPSGNEVWCDHEHYAAGRDIVAFSMTGRERMVLAAPGRYRVQDVAADGRTLVTFDNCRRELIGGRRGDPFERNLSWFDWSFLSGMTHDGSRVCIEEQGAARRSELVASVYMRAVDGSPGVAIGEGRARGISPDGKHVVAMIGAQLMMIPTGAGEPRPIETGGLRTIVWGEFNADGSLFVVAGSEQGRAERLYAIDMAGGNPRAISPEGVSWPFAVSPNGHAAASVCGGNIVVYPIDGGEPRVVGKSREGERVVAWSSEGNTLFVCARGRISVDIDRVEIESGARSLWHTIRPSDPAGIMDLFPVKVTPDGERYTYGYRRYLSDLLIVRGLHS